MGTERTEKPAFRIRGMVRAAVILGAGLAVGVIIRFFDLYTTNLGNMFSELSVWVFLGPVISVRSRTPFQAAGAVFGFCFGMLAAYYTTARLTHSIYSPVMARGWWAFSLLTPLLGYCAWHAGGRDAPQGSWPSGLLRSHRRQRFCSLTGCGAGICC